MDGRPEYVRAFVAQIQDWLAGQHGLEGEATLETLVEQCFDSLRHFGMRKEMDQLFGQVVNSLRCESRLSPRRPSFRS